MRITWSSRAKNRALEYGEYIAQDNPDAASDWIEGILNEVERLMDFPEQGRKVPEVSRADVREIFFLSHRVIYRIESKRIVILRFVTPDNYLILKNLNNKASNYRLKLTARPKKSLRRRT